jgi:hypothetical protein
MKDTWRAGLKLLEVERNVANLHHYAERSRHHTKDKQRLVVSVVAYDSLPGHQRFHRHCARQAEFDSSWPRQQHVNSKLRFVPILFLLCLHIYRPFRFDFAREFVFRATLIW